MEQKQNPLAPEAATDEPASPANQTQFADPPLVSDCLGETLAETLADTFPPGCRKPRHDGWIPEAVETFLRALAATGVVDHAARAAGLSVTAAYNFRNSRRGRAFAKVWDAVLVHRARARLASELQGRAVAGCVSVRKRDGIVVGEYHYYDNRLAMTLLTRLDRLAEREAASEAHLRVLSEDLDEFIDCVAEGGDADAFVETRRPPSDPESPAPEPVSEPNQGAAAADEDQVNGNEIWEEDDGLWTSFPPPEGFDGDEQGDPCDYGYKRRLSAAEQAVLDRDDIEERTEEVARGLSRRDRYFGFYGGLSPWVVSLFDKVDEDEPEDADAEDEPVSDPPAREEG